MNVVPTILIIALAWVTQARLFDDDQLVSGPLDPAPDHPESSQVPNTTALIIAFASGVFALAAVAIFCYLVYRLCKFLRTRRNLGNGQQSNVSQPCMGSVEVNPTGDQQARAAEVHVNVQPAMSKKPRTPEVHPACEPQTPLVHPASYPQLQVPHPASYQQLPVPDDSDPQKNPTGDPDEAKSEDSTPQCVKRGQDADNRVEWCGSPAWLPKCVRPECKCTATFSGHFGDYCCRECREGTPCLTPKHTKPVKPSRHGPKPRSYYVESPSSKFTAKFLACKNPDCPCLSTWNATDDEFCCKTCKLGTPCQENVHWTIFHGTVLECAHKIGELGFKATTAQYGELGEGIYGTCVHPSTSKSAAGKALSEEVEKAKRFAHNYDIRKNEGEKNGPSNIPVIVVCSINFTKVQVRSGSDPEGDDDRDANKKWVVGKASQWKLDGAQACFTTHTDGARSPYIATNNSEICFRHTMTVGAMRVIRLDNDGCPNLAAKRQCGYKKNGHRCPCEPCADVPVDSVRERNYTGGVDIE